MGWGELYLEGKRTRLEQIRTTEEMRILMERRAQEQQYNDEFVPQLQQQRAEISKQRREFQFEFRKAQQDFSDGLIDKKKYTQAVESFERFDVEAANQMAEVYATMMTSGNRFAMEAGKAGFEALNAAAQRKAQILDRTRQLAGARDLEAQQQQGRSELESQKQQGRVDLQEDAQTFTAEQNAAKAAAKTTKANPASGAGEFGNLIETARGELANYKGALGLTTKGGVKEALDPDTQRLFANFENLKAEKILSMIKAAGGTKIADTATEQKLFSALVPQRGDYRSTIEWKLDQLDQAVQRTMLAAEMERQYIEENGSAAGFDADAAMQQAAEMVKGGRGQPARDDTVVPKDIADLLGKYDAGP